MLLRSGHGLLGSHSSAVCACSIGCFLITIKICHEVAESASQMREGSAHAALHVASKFHPLSLGRCWASLPGQAGTYRQCHCPVESHLPHRICLAYSCAAKPAVWTAFTGSITADLTSQNAMPGALLQHDNQAQPVVHPLPATQCDNAACLTAGLSLCPDIRQRGSSIWSEKQHLAAAAPSGVA